MFDEIAGNFSHKRLKAILWLLAVVLFFLIVRAVHSARLAHADKPGENLSESKDL